MSLRNLKFSLRPHSKNVKVCRGGSNKWEDTSWKKGGPDLAGSGWGQGKAFQVEKQHTQRYCQGWEMGGVRSSQRHCRHERGWTGAEQSRATWIPQDHEDKRWPRWGCELRQGKGNGEQPVCPQCGAAHTLPAAHRSKTGSVPVPRAVAG